MTTHVFFDPDNVDWNSFLTIQEGRGKYFVGTRYQRGYGLMQNIARFLLPIAKNIGTTMGQEGIAAGSKILGDLAQGREFKESFKEHAKQGIENLGSKMQQCGKGKKTLAGGRRKRKNQTTISNKPKRRYIDQLTF